MNDRLGHEGTNMADAKELKIKAGELINCSCHRIYQNRIEENKRNIERTEIDGLGEEWVHLKGEGSHSLCKRYIGSNAIEERRRIVMIGRMNKQGIDPKEEGAFEWLLKTRSENKMKGKYRTANQALNRAIKRQRKRVNKKNTI